MFPGSQSGTEACRHLRARGRLGEGKVGSKAQGGKGKGQRQQHARHKKEVEACPNHKVRPCLGRTW